MPSAASKAFVVLMYHHVVESPSSVYDVTPAQLEDHLQRLIDNGYSGGDMAALNRPALDDLPAKQIFLTFDDGHKSSLRAAEIAQKFNIRAAFYITKNFCLDRDHYLTAAEIRELAHVGVIGAHGVTHYPLHHLPQPKLEEELALSKSWLENIVGETVDTMSYPGGGYNQNVVQTTRAAGYRLVGTSREWWNAPEHVASSRMFNRVAIKTHTSSATVLNLVNRRPAAYVQRRLFYEFSWNTRQLLSPSIVAFIRRTRSRIRKKL
ncbi:MAG: polysaccharide deacetylase family protein [Anaerolineae bacterium]|nr:polysaccharide deacetylase family protein [Anaerolineae bacterium]